MQHSASVQYWNVIESAPKKCLYRSQTAIPYYSSEIVYERFCPNGAKPQKTGVVVTCRIWNNTPSTTLENNKNISLDIPASERFPHWFLWRRRKCEWWFDALVIHLWVWALLNMNSSGCPAIFWVRNVSMLTPINFPNAALCTTGARGRLTLMSWEIRGGQRVVVESGGAEQ